MIICLVKYVRCGRVDLIQTYFKFNFDAILLSIQSVSLYATGKLSIVLIFFKSKFVQQNTIYRLSISIFQVKQLNDTIEENIIIDMQQ